jgi:hypothetical protein
LVWLISVAVPPVDPLRLRPVEFCKAAKFWRPVGRPHNLYCYCFSCKETWKQPWLI